MNFKLDPKQFLQKVNYGRRQERFVGLYPYYFMKGAAIASDSEYAFYYCLKWHCIRVKRQATFLLARIA